MNKRMAPQVGLEPTTLRLTARRVSKLFIGSKGFSSVSRASQPLHLRVLLDNLHNKTFHFNCKDRNRSCHSAIAHFAGCSTLPKNPCITIIQFPMLR